MAFCISECRAARPAGGTGSCMGATSARPVIVGRDAERVLLSGFLDAGTRAGRMPVAGRTGDDSSVAADGGAEAVAAILTGPAGIGKTALWEWALEQASSLGYLVLASRAGIAEAQLPWVGLTDLLRPVPALVLVGLPPPQRRALQVAMLQSDLGEPVNERAVGTALWSVLSAQAQSGPVLIALDDLPYMDAASAGALRFALRRMGPASRVRLVATARGEGSRWAPLDGLPGDQVLSVGVGPVTVGALFELLAARLAVRLARPVLLRVHVTSGGNPLYALELARALDRLEIIPQPGVPLPVPTSLDALVAERVRSVPPDVLQIAAGTAASWRFTDAGLEPGAVERAVLAGLVVVDEPSVLGGPRIVRAAHPLVSAAAYAALRAEEMTCSSGPGTRLWRRPEQIRRSPGRLRPAWRRRSPRARPISRWNCHGWRCSTRIRMPIARRGWTCWPTR
jgi:hypothetical protein